jgi:hypothetical protein
MVQTAAKKKKRKTDLRSLINKMLDDAMRTRKGFKPNQLASYMKARNERRRQNMIAMRPERRMPSHIKTTKKEEEIEIAPPFTREGITKALDLGEGIDLGKKGRIREWAIG